MKVLSPKNMGEITTLKNEGTVGFNGSSDIRFLHCFFQNDHLQLGPYKL